jgi:hypothetical protein
MYLSDTAGKVYSGVISSTGVVATAITTIDDFDSITSFPLAKQLIDGTVYNFQASTQAAKGTVTYAAAISGVCRNEISQEFLVAHGTSLTSLQPASLTQNFQTTVSTINLIWAKSGEDISAGNVDVMSYAQLVDAINIAFEEAFLKLPSATFQVAPTLSLNYATGLLTLNYSSDYSVATAGILMNPALIQLVYFPNTVDTVDATMNRIILAPSSTSETQVSRSIYQFNQLDKILFISNTMYVLGSYFGNNSSNNIITDVDVPINEAGYMNNAGNTLYYQPTFLRPYQLGSQMPLTRIQVQVWYAYQDGTQYQLYVPAGQSWDAKLIFIRQF